MKPLKHFNIHRKTKRSMLPRLIMFIVFMALSALCLAMDGVTGLGASVLLATGAAAGAVDNELLDFFKNELSKINFNLNPEAATDLKNSYIAANAEQTNALSSKFDELIEEVKNSQKNNKLSEGGDNKLWCAKLLTENELNSRLPEDKLNAIGFDRYLRHMFKAQRNSLGDDAAANLKDVANNIRMQHAVHNETTTTEGGYLVPVPTGNLLLDALRASGIWMSDTTVLPLSSNTIKIPVLAASGHTTTAAGTLFKKETSTATPRRYSVGAYTFGIAQPLLKDYGFIIPVTRELEEDGVASIMSLVMQYATEYFGILGDDILFRGNGQSSTDQTLGIYEYTALTEYELGGVAFNSLTYDDIILGDAMHRTVDRANLKRYMSPSVWAHIKTRKEPGTGAYYLSGEERKSNTLEGKPVVETDSAYTMDESAADRPMIITGNFKRILTAVKAGVGMDVIKVSQSDVASFYDGTNTRHMWQEGMLGIRLNMRFDIVCPFQNRLVAHVTKAS